MSEFEFKEGDRVKCAFFGAEVFTLEKFGQSIGFSLRQVPLTFLDDGRYCETHTNPVLTLVERPTPPRNPLRPKLSGHVNLYKTGHAFTYPTRAEADAKADHDRIACVELKEEHEV